MGSFEQHLGTNYVPSADDIVEINKLLDASDKEAQSISAEIDLLEQQLHVLQEKKSKIREYAEQHRALISPARRLSRDILEEIFLACLPTDRNPCMNVTEAPMLLTQICSSWRSISHSTPRLWAAIHIVVPSGSIDRPKFPDVADYMTMQERLVEQELEQRKTAAREWLGRSGACPLSISIYQCPSDAGTWDSDLVQYFRRMFQLRVSFIAGIILPYHERWSCLDLFLSRKMLQNLVDAGLTAESLEHLTGFHITYLPGVPEFDRLEEQDISSLLPPTLTSLTHTFRIDSSQMISSFSSNPFWTQLTEFNWTVLRGFPDAPVGIIWDIISCCRALRSLKLQVNVYGNFNHSPERNTERIDLRYLTSLSLSVVPIPEFAGFVKQLNLPSLRKLYYEIRDDVRPEDTRMFPEPLSVLMRSCGDTLEMLQLHRADILDSQDLINLLTFTPHLKGLKLFGQPIDHSRWGHSFPDPLAMPCIPDDHDGIGDELLCALSPQGDGSEVCPRLEMLEFNRGMPTKFTERALKEFVKARNHAHQLDPQIPVLRKICIPINGWKQKEDNGPDEKVSLGSDSAVYFRTKRTYRPESTLSPYVVKYWSGNSYDIHTEL